MLAQALARRRWVRRREHWPRERIEAYQRERVRAIVAHAAAHSRYYRRLYGGPIAGPDVQLTELAAVRKPDLMAHFDAVVTDERLRLDAVRRHAETLTGDSCYLRDYRVMASSGSSGVPGIYVWHRRDWLALLSIAMRVSDRLGYGPRLPRLKVVSISAPSPRHMSYRLARSLDIGITRRFHLDATTPIETLVDAVAGIRPDILATYPSIAAALASAQLDGALDIAPGAVSVSSELCSPEMRARIAKAWGIRPVEVYAMTEAGVVATSCEHGTLHAHEDSVVLEPVDRDLRPVPPGEPGERTLVTSLLNRTQPMIRLEVSDQFALGTSPCPCGRGLQSIERFLGRADDMLTLPAADGSGTISLHPVHLRSLLGGIDGIDGYQVTLRGTTLSVDVLAGDAAVAGSLKGRIDEALSERGVGRVEIRVNRVDALERERGGKLKLVRVE